MSLNKNKGGASTRRPFVTLLLALLLAAVLLYAGSVIVRCAGGSTAPVCSPSERFLVPARKP
jgi:hypothetical protein